ncbi:MAG: transglutaminase-like cysteine peptidase [Rubrivivax sp.]|nr:transglutaminase-like cysteine peptidase [Rubrivivax sp.]
MHGPPVVPARRLRRRAPHWRRARVLALAVAISLALCTRPSFSALDVGRMQQAAVALGPRAERAVGELRDLLSRLKPMDDPARVEQVNQFINRRVGFATDRAAWNAEDYWASPLETLGKGQGDCEDYAIAKYFALVAAGVPAGRLRLVYVRAILPASWGLPPGPQAHMVLAYYPDLEAEPQILDNLMAEIRPASRRPDLTPVFSFNGEGLWTGAGTQPAGDPQARLSRWREVMLKARAEGFE